MDVLNLLTVANVVTHDVALGFSDDSPVLLSCSLFLVVVIVPHEEGVIVRDHQAGECTGFCLSRLGVNKLDHLIKADRTGIGTGKTSQDRRHTDRRENSPEVRCFHVCYLTKQYQR
jgi:hypothetical protein